jgi:hypothetical protein
MFMATDLPFQGCTSFNRSSIGSQGPASAKAMAMIEELEATVNRVEADVVSGGMPIDLGRFFKSINPRWPIS